jgi:hypothetical protein
MPLPNLFARSTPALSLLDQRRIEGRCLLCTAVDLGLIPRVITHGQLLTPALMDEITAIGVSEILVSLDSIDPDQYARIRRGSSSRRPDHHRRTPSLF